ncbi:hypothetical protein L9X50_18035 [Vibrio aestuarianus]|uniref:GTP pyrophosphokinase n=1 Tax=Vibrio aestuarianus TaxID=28171 RepID=UPI00237C96A2|nr:hypothetical protein [Vibrio aestuarianus]MDE1319879.1 hypothetical protein [Vibrio aestuarianus]
MSNSNILKDFEVNRGTFLSLEQMTNSLLSTLISNQSINVHSITSRTKTLSSLCGKVDRPGKNYAKLEDITDLVGIRVTTYFSDEVDEIADLIFKEFTIDAQNSIDKRRSQEPDRFGYMSLHLVASYSKERTRLQEYQSFNGIKFEIQIRSILQHAWAEIEHDIGYKSTKQVPDQLKRRFSRLSGLLELADEEFLAIKNSLLDYKDSLPEKVNNSPELVRLDLSSLESFVKTNDTVIKLEKEMQKVFGCKIFEPTKYCLNNCLDFMNILGYENLADILADYRKYQDKFIPFLKAWLTRDLDGVEGSWDSIEQGISLLYLTYVKLADEGDDELAHTVLGSAPFGDVSRLWSSIKHVAESVKI